MPRNYEPYLEKLVFDGIETKNYMIDMITGIKEISGKLDTLISLIGVEEQRQQQQQLPQLQILINGNALV